MLRNLVGVSSAATLGRQSVGLGMVRAARSATGLGRALGLRRRPRSHNLVDTPPGLMRVSRLRQRLPVDDSIGIKFGGLAFPDGAHTATQTMLPDNG